MSSPLDEALVRYVGRLKDDRSQVVFMINRIGETLAQKLEILFADVQIISIVQEEERRRDLGALKVSDISRDEKQRWPLVLSAKLSRASVNFTFVSRIAFGYQGDETSIWIGDGLHTKELYRSDKEAVARELTSIADEVIKQWVEAVELSGDCGAYEKGKVIKGFSQS
jgi:hypothetical protein